MQVGTRGTQAVAAGSWAGGRGAQRECGAGGRVGPWARSRAGRAGIGAQAGRWA